MSVNKKLSDLNIKNDNHILRVMTEHTGPFKTLIEVLKELLPEAILEFIEKNSDDDEEGSDKKKKGGLKIMAIDSTRKN